MIDIQTGSGISGLRGFTSRIAAIITPFLLSILTFSPLNAINEEEKIQKETNPSKQEIIHKSDTAKENEVNNPEEKEKARRARAQAAEQKKAYDDLRDETRAKQERLQKEKEKARRAEAEARRKQAEEARKQEAERLRREAEEKKRREADHKRRMKIVNPYENAFWQSDTKRRMGSDLRLQVPPGYRAVVYRNPTPLLFHGARGLGKRTYYGLKNGRLLPRVSGEVTSGLRGGKGFFIILILPESALKNGVPVKPTGSPIKTRVDGQEYHLIGFYSDGIDILLVETEEILRDHRKVGRYDKWSVERVYISVVTEGERRQ